MTDITLIIVPLFVIFWVLCIISAISNKFKNKNEKVFWIIALVFVPFLSLFYIFMKKDLLED